MSSELGRFSVFLNAHFSGEICPIYLIHELAFLTGRTYRTGCYLTIVVDISQLEARLPMVLRIKNRLERTPSRPSHGPTARKSHHRSKLQEITAGLAISEQITSPFSAIGAALALEHAFGSCHLDPVGAEGNGCECCRFTVDDDMIMIDVTEMSQKTPRGPSGDMLVSDSF